MLGTEPALLPAGMYWCSEARAPRHELVTHWLILSTQVSHTLNRP